ncbi:MAG: hypothetical protein ACM3YM_05740 [Sphingomonadales bacterium]
MARPTSANSADVALIRRFFGLIDRHRPAEAAAMMGPEIAAGPGARAAWTRQFSAIRSASVRDVRPSALDGDGGCRSYRVTIDVQLAPRTGRTPIPDYGWGPNPNLRWITVCNDHGSSRHIASFGTGP